MPGNANDLNKRLSRLETASISADRRPTRSFIIEGPVDLGAERAVAFLRECGHDLRDGDFNMVRVVIGADNGRPIDLPLRDRTAHYATRHPLAASPLHLQPRED